MGDSFSLIARFPDRPPVELSGIGPLDLAQPRLAPQRIGDLGSHQARRVQLFAARRQCARAIRIGLVDQQLDRHARIDHEAHQKSSR